MVESLDTNQKQKWGEKKESEKLPRVFIDHVDKTPASFL
jgi:hypothetical protein